MIQIPSHVPHKGRIDDLKPRVIFGQTKHVTPEMELFLSNIRHSLTNNFSDVLSHDGIFLSEVSDEQTQPINFRRSNVDIISRFFERKIILFFDGRRIDICQIFLYIFESNKWNYFGF